MSFFRICLLALILLVLACTGNVSEKEPALLKTQPLIGGVNDFAPWQYSVGDFLVSWHGSELSDAQLTISSASNSSRVDWQSLSGQSFVLAADAVVKAKQGGSTKVIEVTNTACQGHSVESTSLKNGALTIAGTLDCSVMGGVPYSLVFSAPDTGHLQFDLHVDHASIGRTGLIFESAATERIFGFGEQYSAFDLKGRRVPIYVEEQGLARGAQPLSRLLDELAEGLAGEWHQTYAPVPYFMTTRPRAMVLENREFSIFDLRSDKQITTEVYSSHLVARLISGDTPLDIIEKYTSFSGRMRELPEWITEGAILGLQGGTDRTLTAVDALEKANGKLSAVWLQDWVGQRDTKYGKRLWWNWVLDQDRYEDWSGMVSDLARRGIRVLGYINPYLIDISLKGDVDQRNLYREAFDEGYLLKKKDGTLATVNQGGWYAYIVDITNPGASKWLKDVIKDEMLGSGQSGWMADFGESLPWDAALASGEDASTAHNRFPEIWAELNREAIDEAGVGDDVVFFMRAGFIESPANSTLFWAGDQATNWDNFDGIKTSVTALLTSGLAGYSFNHSDVGGYFSLKEPAEVRRSKELLLRWTELGAFQVIFRTHEGLLPDWSHQFDSDPETLRHFARFSNVYHAWNDYRETLVAEAASKGWPVVRHPYLHYPEERAFWPLSYQQYLIGSELWFAPVLDPGVNEVSIRLPKGNWIHAFTDRTYVSEGADDALTIPAPVGTPAVFYRQGSAVGEQFRQNLIENGVIDTPGTDKDQRVRE
jgi:alpha-glucosidase